MKMPVKSVGILGGGQLARMLAEAAYTLKLKPVVFAKSKSDCATQVSSYIVDDIDAFIEKVDLVTIENEFVDLEILKRIESKKSVFPSIKTLSLIQNKLSQKVNFKKYKIPTSEFCKVEDVASLQEAIKKLGTKIVLKTQTMGYDGKGTFIMDFNKVKPVKFFLDHPDFIGYAEKFVKFKKELAVVVVRSVRDEVETFPIVETFQKNGICNYVIKPKVDKKTSMAVQKLAKRIIRQFDGVGVFGIEMFLDYKNKLFINELAPRVHNSGHITMDACNVSQFEQHLRAIIGLPLVTPKWKYKNAIMLNILGKGSVVPEHIDVKLKSSEFVHWYGKSGLSKNRKLGHINIVSNKAKDKLLVRAQKIRKMIKA